MTRFQLKHSHASSKEAYPLNNLLNPRGDKDIHVKLLYNINALQI